MDERRRLGKLGEVAAARYLRASGYDILCANYRSYVGEIDLVAFDEKGVLVFVEVKSRTLGHTLGAPADAVGYSKRRRLAATAKVFMRSIEYRGERRFDIVEVLFDETHDLPTAQCKLIKNAFNGGRYANFRFSN